MLKNLLKK